MRILALLGVIMLGVGSREGVLSALQAAELPPYFPTASELGPGWLEGERRFDEETFTGARYLFEDAVLASYKGPDGANAALLAGRVAPDRRSTAWDELTDDGLLGIELALVGGEEVELGPESAPEGCVEANRWEGRSDPFFAVGGITACAISADLYLVAATQGVVNGMEGRAASDALIALALSKGAT